MAQTFVAEIYWAWHLHSANREKFSHQRLVCELNQAQWTVLSFWWYDRTICRIWEFNKKTFCKFYINVCNDRKKRLNDYKIGVFEKMDMGINYRWYSNHFCMLHALRITIIFSHFIWDTVLSSLFTYLQNMQCSAQLFFFSFFSKISGITLAWHKNGLRHLLLFSRVYDCSGNSPVHHHRTRKLNGRICMIDSISSWRPS